MQPITANFLVTKQDFFAWKRASCKARLRRWEIWFCRALGGLLAAFGIAGMGLFPGAAAKIACGLILCASLVITFYYDTIYPYWVSRRLAAAWETMRPQTYCIEFYEDRFSVGSECYRAELGYDMLCRVYEDADVFLLDMGAGELRFVPKRALSGDEQLCLRQRFKRVMNQNYKQEGVG